MPVSARAALLFALSLGPGYARELSDRLRDRTEGRITIRDGSLYPALRELELAGVIDLVNPDGVPGDEGKLRRVYKLTRLGELEAAKVESTLRCLLDGE